MLVETLADGWQEAGVYRAVWDAKGIASGVYFYRLTMWPTGEVQKLSVARKLVLMK